MPAPTMELRTSATKSHLRIPLTRCAPGVLSEVGSMAQNPSSNEIRIEEGTDGILQHAKLHVDACVAQELQPAAVVTRIGIDDADKNRPDAGIDDGLRA